MLAGNAVFVMASIACGLATSGPLLLTARVVQGVGAAFMVTGAIALVAGAFPNHGQRARAFGIIGVISGERTDATCERDQVRPPLRYLGNAIVHAVPL